MSLGEGCHSYWVVTTECIPTSPDELHGNENITLISHQSFNILVTLSFEWSHAYVTQHITPFMSCYSMHYLGSRFCNSTYCLFISMSKPCNSINYPFTPCNWMYYQTLQWFQSIELNVLLGIPMHSHNIIISLSL